LQQNQPKVGIVNMHPVLDVLLLIASWLARIAAAVALPL
jgi:hypothetical protein